MDEFNRACEKCGKVCGQRLCNIHDPNMFRCSRCKRWMSKISTMNQYKKDLTMCVICHCQLNMCTVPDCPHLAPGRPFIDFSDT